jgi:tagaturonate epimerase
MTVEPYTCGVGDRFGQQGRAQLEAILLARQEGINVYPVWNKSNREHALIGSGPEDVRVEAEVP